MINKTTMAIISEIMHVWDELYLAATHNIAIYPWTNITCATNRICKSLETTTESDMTC